MATLKHDAQGFLIGEVLDRNRDLMRLQESSMTLWRGIRTDVSAIARAIGVQTQAAARSHQPGQPNSSTPRAASSGRTAGGNNTSGPATPAGRGGIVAVGSPAAARRAAQSAGARAAATVAAVASRDAKGRFVAGAKAEKDGPGDVGVATPSAMSGTFGKLTSAVDRMATSLQGADNIDPTINAVKEVTDVVAPLGRGMAGLFGRNAERKKERWYNRIWKALTDKKAAAPVVVGGGTNVSLGGAGLAGGVLGRGVGGIAKGAGGLLGGVLKGGGRLLRRVPVLGALLAGGAALGSLLGMDDDASKTPEQNRAQRYRGAGEAAGMGIGGVLGGVLGSLLGPAGTVAGALVGSIVGEKVGGAVGDWTKGLVDSDIGGTIVAAWGVVTAAWSGAWESFTADMKRAWGDITKTAGEWWDNASNAAGKLTEKVDDLATAANDWIREKTGVDVKSSVSSGWDSAKAWAGEKASQAADAARSVGSAMVPNTVKRAVSAGVAAATQAKAGYDEARGNPTTAGAPTNALQSGARAAGGMAGSGINKIVETGAGYNVVQKADGSVVRQDGARNWRNNNPGNIEWKPGGFAEQHGAIGSDGRFAIFPSYEAGRAAKAKLIFDSENYKNLSLAAAISRYAPPNENNTAAYQRSVLAAVGGGNKKMSSYSAAEQEAIMDAMQRVEGYRPGRTKTISAGIVTPSVRSTPVQGPAVPMGQGANVPTSVPASIPQLPTDTVPAPPSPAGGGRGQLGVTIRNEIGQNVPDRGIAHVQTGGLGG